MLVIPAVDIMGKKCVRLAMGDFGRVETFSEEPLRVVEGFVGDGAELIHVVDLDGARTGRMKNFETIEKIIKSSDAPVEVGGGVRDKETAEKILGLGASIVFGTAAIENAKLVEYFVDEFGGARVVLGLDARENRVVVEGWQRTVRASVFELARKFERIGVGGILFTSVERDGMLSGPDVRAVGRMARAVGIPVIASGGVSSLGDLEELRRAGAWGAVVGKALYKNKFRLKEAIECSRRRGT